jgi:hypothetical protein
MSVLTRETAPKLCPSRVTAVETGGKWRIVSVADVEMNNLGPLHTAIYNRLSRCDWLLRGEASPSKFKNFTFRQGCVFVSGDYESATDNLSLFVQQVILQRVLRGTVSVPDGVKELARCSQRMELTCEGRTVLQKRGQLMGNLLSFPLLCLVNYLAFRYYGGYRETRGLPVKINGDDIVFQSSETIARKWQEGVVGSGLVLSRGKTVVDRRYFTLNSRLFVARGSTPRLLPSVRSSAFGFRTPDDPVASLQGRWHRVVKDFPCGGKRREVLEEEFLRLNTRFVVASRRSLTRGLDCKFSPNALFATNLWKRECWYLSLEKEDPLPISPKQREEKRIPEGWECVRVENYTAKVRDEERKIASEWVRLAWEPSTSSDSDYSVAVERYKERCNLAPYYTPKSRLGLAKRARLLRLSVQNAKRYLKPCLLRGSVDNGDRGLSPTSIVTCPYDILRISRPSGKRCWLPTGFIPVPFFSNYKTNPALGGSVVCEGPFHPVRGRVCIAPPECLL